MTAQQLFDLTVGIMGITPANASSYNDTIIPQINAVLAMSFKLENNNRQFAGLTELTVIPTVSALSDTLTYQDNIIRNVLVYGVAQLLSLSDDDTIKAGFFENRFFEGMKNEKKLISQEIKDYYSGEE